MATPAATLLLLCDLQRRLVLAGYSSTSINWGPWWEAEYYAV